MQAAERSKEGSDAKLGAAGSMRGGKLGGTAAVAQREASQQYVAFHTGVHAGQQQHNDHMPLRARRMRSQLYSSRCCTFSIVSLSPACTLLLASSTCVRRIVGGGWQGCEWSRTAQLPSWLRGR